MMARKVRCGAHTPSGLRPPPPASGEENRQARGVGEPLLVDVSSVHRQLCLHLLGAASALLALPRLTLGIEQLQNVGKEDRRAGGG
jgi:hypothetical protein